MRNIFKLGILFFLLYVCFMEKRPAEAVPLLLQQGVEYWITQDSSASIAEILSSDAKKFHTLESDHIRIDNPDNVLWLRIPATVFEQHWSKYSKSIFLALRNEYILYADLYYPELGGQGHERLTYNANFNVEEEQYFPTSYPTFQLEQIPPGAFVYLRIKTDIPITFDIEFFNSNAFYNYFLTEQTHGIIFYTFLVAMILYYFFFYIMTAYLPYFILTTRQMAIFMIIFAISGYMRFYVTAAVHFTAVTLLLGVLLYSMAALAFVKIFFKADKSFTRILKIFSLLLGGAVLAAYRFVDSPYWTFLFSAFLLLLPSCFEGWALYLNFYRNRWQGTLFIISRSSFLIGIFVLFWEKTFLVPDAYIIFARLGIILEPIILAFVLLPETRRKLLNYSALEKTSEHYKALSQHDSMTGLCNKASLLSFLGENIQKCFDQKKTMAFLMLDIDNFKKFNDRWGHVEGDKAINLTASVLKHLVRDEDLSARYGGEEFSVVIINCSKETALHVAERIRSICEERSSSLGEGKIFTISIGGAFLQEHDDKNSLIERADAALYRAKSKGRNCVEFDF